jgi:hypothetical protein
MDRRLLVPHEDVLDGVLLEERVVDVEDSSARIPEDVLDAFFLKAAHDDLCAGEFQVVFLSRSRETHPPAPTQPHRRLDAGLGAGPVRLIGRHRGSCGDAPACVPVRGPLGQSATKKTKTPSPSPSAPSMEPWDQPRVMHRRRGGQGADSASIARFPG